MSLKPLWKQTREYEDLLRIAKLQSENERLKSDAAWHARMEAAWRATEDGLREGNCSLEADLAEAREALTDLLDDAHKSCDPHGWLDPKIVDRVEAILAKVTP